MRSRLAYRILFVFVLGLSAPVCAALAPTAADGSVVSAGLELHYTRTGQGSPIVVLAGGPGFGASYMQPVVDLLAAHHTVILLEQRGTGRSTPPREDASTVNEDLMVSDLEALRSKLGYERWTLVGHSFGSFTTMRYAMEHPDRVRRLVLLATMAPRRIDDHLRRNLEARIPAESGAAAGRLFADYAKASTDADRDAIMARINAIVLPAYFHDQSKVPGFLADMQKVGLNSQTANLVQASIGNYDLLGGLRRLTTPTLIVQGRDDPLDPDMADKTRDAIPGAQLVILEDCGHFAWIEKPDALRDELDSFIDAD